jgi:hypothetical protein
VISICLFAALAGAGCMTSGTFDNIPKRPVIESTSTSFDGPTPSGNTYAPSSSGCPQRAASGSCPFERVQCAFDDHGCEVCTCSP